MIVASNRSTVEDLTVFIQVEGSDLVTDSRAVAVAFGKRHKHVIRDIRRMLDSSVPEIATHARTNFGPSSFKGRNGKQEPMFRMTAKGFSELAMSYSGDESRVVRIRFLNAFEEVSARLARAEKSITERLFDLERREMPSKVKGAIGSRLMNERRKEKPELEAERSVLLDLAQPKLVA